MEKPVLKTEVKVEDPLFYYGFILQGDLESYEDILSYIKNFGRGRLIYQHKSPLYLKIIREDLIRS